MIIATLKKQFNNNVELFDVFKDDEYVVTTNRAGIAYVTEVSLKRMSSHFLGKGYKDYQFYSVGNCEKLYKFKNRVGSIEDHAEWESLTLAAIKRRVERHKDAYVGIRVNGKQVEMHDLDDVLYGEDVKVTESKLKQIEPERRIVKYPYKGENKRYVDYLMASTFKGW